MKKLCLLAFAVVLCLSSYGQYVDLGLPSGTKWKSSNETGGHNGLYTYEEAMSTFGNELPTRGECNELINLCKWTWNGNGYKVTGPNGNSIILPAAGCLRCNGRVKFVEGFGNYWSNTATSDKKGAFCIAFTFKEVARGVTKCCEGLSVRLVQNSSRQTETLYQYVDLGLPSGTMWMNKNEENFYKYDDAVEKFGINLPTKEQFAELLESCKWTWNGNGYKVTGPNGNSIILPAAGLRRRNGRVEFVGSFGEYWSSTPNINKKVAWHISFSSEKTYGFFNKRSEELSVRLVQDYVDLALPSGTKWRCKNKEGFYSYDEAIKTFGNELPTYEQFVELLKSCKWKWNKRGYEVIGPNGNSIFLPAAGEISCDGGENELEGEYGIYWSSTLYDPDSSWSLSFFSDDREVFEYERCLRSSVRLVQEIPRQYVDLGLPSGTKWMNKNEEGFYNFGDAVEKFGNRLPTKEQLEELKNQCEWTWNASGYKVTGPNGNSIFLPAAGNELDWEGLGEYWSSTLVDSKNAWTLYFDKEVKISEDDRNLGQSVRLVQK